MTIFPQKIISKNGFWLITHLFSTNLYPIRVATPPKSTMPRRSKWSKHGVKNFNFFRVDFFRGEVGLLMGIQASELSIPGLKRVFFV